MSIASPSTPPVQTPHQEASTVTDSGFTTTSSTPNPPPLVDTATPVPSETDQTPTLHSVLLHFLENETEEHDDFAEESTLVAEATEDEVPASRFFIAEQMRLALERAIGLENLVKCYNVVQVRPLEEFSAPVLGSLIVRLNQNSGM